MKTYNERRAEATYERQRIAAAHEEAQDEQRRIIRAAAAARDADTAALEALIAREDDEAKASLFATGDARLFPVVRAMHDEVTNRGTVDLIQALEALDQLALSLTSEPYPMLRVGFLLAELHRQTRPGIVEHLAEPRAWHSATGGGFGGVELATDLRKALGVHDVAMTRAAFEKLDARLYSFTQRPVDEQATLAWQARLQPDPRVLREYLAAATEREREEQVAAAAAARAFGQRSGGQTHDSLPDRGGTYL